MKTKSLNIIDELEIRLNYTDAQIEQKQKEIRKAQDELSTLQGQKIAYKELLENISECNTK